MMTGRAEKAGEFLRANGLGLLVGLALVAVAIPAVRWIASHRAEPPPPRKVMQFTIVNVQPAQPARPLPPPPAPPKIVEQQPQTTRVNLKPTDFAPPDMSRPAASPPSPGGGRLSLAAEGEGPGDAFNLVGNPGGRALLSGGGLGDSAGETISGAGDLGSGGAGARYGWYYAKVASEIEGAFRTLKPLTATSTRVELRVWTDPAGRISRVQLIRSTGDERVDEAIGSIVGLNLGEPPPRDIPMPMILRLTARRPH